MTEGGHPNRAEIHFFSEALDFKKISRAYINKLITILMLITIDK